MIFTSKNCCLLFFSVDDTYMLIGSANVNQRSMDGQRDTEIAMGCYQSRSEENSNSQDIRAFRMSLWYEHMGESAQVFEHPESLECVQKVHSIGEKMWEIYSTEDVIDMNGVHLVAYLASITSDGSVQDLPDSSGNFPDTRTPVKGKRSKILAPVFTT